MNKEPKQVIVMRTDLGMRKGKMIAQGAHASLGVILSLGNFGLNKKRYFHAEYEFNSYLDKWLMGRFTKVCLRCESEEQLLELFNAAEVAGLPCKLITDAGLTEFDGVPTKTCIAIGPANPDKIDKITGDLKLL
jgi:PTH2 family peptidyl-tRNA hydrolase